MKRLKNTYRNKLENEGLDCDMFININGPTSIKDVDATSFSIDYYHAGHARADDPIMIASQGIGARPRGKRKDLGLMQGGSKIFKKMP